MTFLRAVVTIPKDTGLPDDVIVNTFAFSTTDTPVDSGTLGAIADALGTAYEIPLPFLSSAYNWGTADVAFYNLADPEPRVPIETLPLAMIPDPGTGPSLPAEVSLCLSFEGNPVSGQPQARRRGRVYVGPWQVAGLVDHAAPPGGFVTALKNMGASLLDASDASAVWTWCVFSRSLYEGTTKPPVVPQPLASCFFPVVRGWVDNAWDTQRRRGIAATSRSVFPGLG